MSDPDLKQLPKFLKAILDAGDGDFSVIFTLKKNGTVHNLLMIADEPPPPEGTKWTGRSLTAKSPPKT